MEMRPEVLETEGRAGEDDELATTFKQLLLEYSQNILPWSTFSWRYYALQTGRSLFGFRKSVPSPLSGLKNKQASSTLKAE